MKLFKKKEIKTVKVGAVSPRIRLGDVKYNVSACIEAARRAADEGVQLLAFPELTLTGATCRDMYRNAPICEYAEEGLAEFVKETAELDIMSFIGLPVHIDGEVFNCTAVVYMGEIITVVPRHVIHDEHARYFDRPTFEIYDFTLAGQETPFLVDPVFSTPFDKKILVEQIPFGKAAFISTYGSQVPDLVEFEAETANDSAKFIFDEGTFADYEKPVTSCAAVFDGEWTIDVYNP